MGGIQGIGGVPEPRADRPSNVRDQNTASSTTAAPKDGVAISSAAQAAAAISAVIEAASSQPDVRADRVAEARAAIENGDHQNQDAVNTVAERISKFL